MAGGECPAHADPVPTALSVESPRIRLDVDPDPDGDFVSRPDRVARISFALLEGELPDLRGTGPYATAVIRWPCDERGEVDLERLRAGHVRVVRWTLVGAELATLRVLHRVGWRFWEVDLLVSGGSAAPRFLPTARTLRSTLFAPRLTLCELERVAFGPVSRVA